LVYEEPTNFIESIGKESSNEYEKFVVKVIMGMLKEIFNYIYDEMIIDISDFINMTFMDKSVRSFLFEIIMKI